MNEGGSLDLEALLHALYQSLSDELSDLLQDMPLFMYVPDNQPYPYVVLAIPSLKVIAPNGLTRTMHQVDIMLYVYIQAKSGIKIYKTVQSIVSHISKKQVNVSIHSVSFPLRYEYSDISLLKDGLTWLGKLKFSMIAA